LEDGSLTVSDYSLVISGFPKRDIPEEDLQDYLEEHFGKVHEVSFARRFGKVLTRYRRQVNLNRNIKK